MTHTHLVVSEGSLIVDASLGDHHGAAVPLLLQPLADVLLTPEGKTGKHVQTLRVEATQNPCWN